MLFTGKGDDGSTSFFGCKDRFSKSSPRAEALGTIDELNSLLGMVKVYSRESSVVVGKTKIETYIEQIQQDLFIVQAELADVKKENDKHISRPKVEYLGNHINMIEKELPPIKNFVLSGATQLSSELDYARAVTRRAERRIIALSDSEKNSVEAPLLAYINRLSSMLYALARLSAHIDGKSETPPSYS